MPQNAIPEFAFTKTGQGYRFVDKSPVIDFIIAAWHRSGYSLSHMAMTANLSHSTIRNWDSGKTRHPNWESAARFLHALGYRLETTNGGERFEIKPATIRSRK